jgi:hypothetical protein
LRGKKAAIKNLLGEPGVMQNLEQNILANLWRNNESDKFNVQQVTGN